MMGSVWVVDNTSDMSALIDDHGHTGGYAKQIIANFPHQTATAAECPVGSTDGAVGVGYQGEGDVAFFGEALMTGNILRGNTQDLGILIPNFLIMIAQGGSLLCAAWGVVHRIEVQHQFLTEVVR